MNAHEWGLVALKVSGLVGYSILEYMIGKTDRIKANSMIDLVIQFLAKLKKD